MKRLNRVLAVVIIFSSLLGLVLSACMDRVVLDVRASVEQPQILVINAYHRGYGWTDAQTDAIIEAFDASAYNPIYYIEYLDWKRHPSEENLTLQLELMAHKYSMTDIDIIIAVDDIGMQFAIDYRESLAPGVPIVFTGVFEESAKVRRAGVENITGVYESIDPTGTMEMILELHPDLEHIYIINDNSETGKDVEKEIMISVENYQRAYGYTFEIINNHTYKEVDELLSNPPKKSVVIVGTHNIDSAGDALPNEIFVEELAKWIEVPIYSPYEYLFDHGIVGGSLLSGRLQGARGAEIALEILDGRPADDIKEYAVLTTFNGIDHIYAEKYDIEIGNLTKPFEVINRPVTIFEEYRTEILMVVGIIALLSFFVILLSVNVRIRKKAQYELEMKHEELYEKYEFLASSEESLKVQNQDLLEQLKESHNLAFNDKLTGLPSKNAIELELKRMIDRDANSQTMIMIVDLDNFNDINTAYGLSFGDQLLKYVAERLSDLTDQGYYVGRLGGDDFFVMKRIESGETENSILEKIEVIFAKALIVDSKEINVFKSIGYTVFPADGKDFEDLMTRADLAKKMMKQKSKGMTSRFVPLMIEEVSDRTTMTKALKSAVKEQELYVVFQPQYDMTDDRIVGFEILVRWSSSTVGEVSPDIFIPLAEEMGEIVDIGYYVLEESMKFLEKNTRYLAPDFRLSVNISVIQLLRQDFVERVRSLINLYGVSPKMLEFEITESVMIESFDMVSERLVRLKLMGISIALDDFGTGNASLTQLEKLPISTLKIDKAFIDGIVIEGEAHFFTRSVVDIAHRLGFRVIAEGVEELSQVEYLRACGSHLIQGNWFSRPLRVGAAMRLYVDNRDIL